MWKTFTLMLLCQFFLLPVFSQQMGIGMKLMNNQKKEVHAGSATNLFISLTNTTDSIGEVMLKMTTPDSWKQITDYSSLFIDPNTSVNKILSLYIPEGTKVGDYPVLLEGFKKEGNIPIGKITIPVFVKPYYKIRVEKFQAPSYLLAGDTIDVYFLIQNLSNTDIHVASDIINGKNPETRHLFILADSALIEKVHVKIPQSFQSYAQQHVSLNAIIEENPIDRESCSYSFDLIPSDDKKFDAFNRLPVRISGILASHNRSGKREFGTMFDIRGSGQLGQKNNHNIEFHLRGPDRGGNPLLGLNDEYYLRYFSSKASFVIGDYNYRLSDLTESARTGKGIGAQYAFNKVVLGAYFHLPRYLPGTKQILAIYTEYLASQSLRLKSGYLLKTIPGKDVAQLLTLGGNFKPFSWVNAELEMVGAKQSDLFTMAIKSSVNFHYSSFRSHLAYTHADKYFPGYFSDSRYLSSGITAYINPKINVSLNYDTNHSNLALDTLFSNAPFGNNLSFSSGLRFNSNHTINGGFYIIGREDRSENPLFHYQKYIGRISVQNRFDRLSSSLQIELGKVNNYLSVNEGDLTNVYKIFLSLRYFLNKNFSAETFANYQGGQQYMNDGFHRIYFGGSLRASLKTKTYLSLDYQNNYEVEEYYRDRSLLTLRVNQSIRNKHEIELSTNYNLVKNSLNKTELSILAKYAYTIQIPVSRKTDVGSLTGKVINNGVDKVDGIIFNLNGEIAVTNPNGEFSFPFVKTGTWFLIMDEPTAGIHSIATQAGPYKIVIEPGKGSNFEIGLSKSAKIEGRLIIEEDQNAGKKGYYPVKEDIGNLVIEASCGNEMFRVLTADNGSFVFNDLRPETWKIIVYPNGIPKGYQLVQDQFTLHLESGKVTNLEVPIRKKSREVKFQKQF